MLTRASRATGSTARRPATGSVRRSRASATRTATAGPTSRSAPRRRRPTDARAPARSSSCPGRAGSARRNLAVSPPLQRIAGAMAGAGLGASLAAAGDMDGDGRVDMLAGRSRRSVPRGRRVSPARSARARRTDLALGDRRRSLRRGAGAQFGSAVAAGSRSTAPAATRSSRRPARAARSSWAAPACSNPPTPGVPGPGARARGARGRGGRVLGHRAGGQAAETKLKLCPLMQPKPKYKVVNGKRVKVKQAPCRARPKAKSAAARAVARQSGSSRTTSRPARGRPLESAACPRTPTTARPIPPSATRRS